MAMEKMAMKYLLIVILNFELVLRQVAARRMHVKCAGVVAWCVMWSTFSVNVILYVIVHSSDILIHAARVTV